MGLRGNHFSIFLLNEHSNKVIPKWHIAITVEQCATEASSQKLLLLDGKSHRPYWVVREFGALNAEYDSFITLRPSGPRYLCGRGGRKGGRVRGGIWCKRKQHLPDAHTNSKRRHVTPFTKPAQVQTRKILTWKRSGHKVPSQNKKLFTTDTFWERENQFSPTEWHWLHQPHARAGPMPRSIWPIQNNSTFLCVCFSWYFLSFDVFVLVWVFYSFICFWDRRTWCWVGRFYEELGRNMLINYLSFLVEYFILCTELHHLQITIPYFSFHIHTCWWPSLHFSFCTS